MTVGSVFRVGLGMTVGGVGCGGCVKDAGVRVKPGMTVVLSIVIPAQAGTQWLLEVV